VLNQQTNVLVLLAKDKLVEAKQISRELMMQKEIEGIDDRTTNIQGLIARGLRWLDDPPPPEPAPGGNEPVEGNTNDLEDLLQNLLISEEEENRRREDQCTDFCRESYRTTN